MLCPSVPSRTDPLLKMHPKLEALMAHGRVLGVTQRVATDITPDGRLLRLAGQAGEVLSFASCGYMGLERDPRVKREAIAAIERFGTCFSSSRSFVMSGLHGEAEALLEQIYGRPVVLTQSTTMAHAAAIPVLFAARDLVLADRQVHHSVQTALAALGSRGPEVVYLPHADFDALESAVVQALARGVRKIWYCADGIYSMFGDRLDRVALAGLMDRYDALHAYLDDAHGMSWCGSRGGGSLVDADLPWARVVLATSLSKGFGAGGGLLVVPDRATKLRIGDLGPSLMFSIQLAPPLIGAICAAARIHLGDDFPARQARIRARIADLSRAFAARPALAARTLAQEPGEATPIRFVVLGDGDRVTAVARQLLDRGILVNPVAFPAVPIRQGGLRVSVTAGHETADIEVLADALAEVAGTGAETDDSPRATRSLSDHMSAA